MISRLLKLEPAASSQRVLTSTGIWDKPTDCSLERDALADNLLGLAQAYNLVCCAEKSHTVGRTAAESVSIHVGVEIE